VKGNEVDCIVFDGDKNQPLTGGEREDRLYGGIGNNTFRYPKGL